MSAITQHCARCRRPAPDQLSSEFLEWEASGETGEQVICPGCLTLGEERAIADDADETAEAGRDILLKEAEAHRRLAHLKSTTDKLTDEVVALIEEARTEGYAEGYEEGRWAGLPTD
jgi:flagellar biosynthesis/type III secretory pathway protein FliH